MRSRCNEVSVGLPEGGAVAVTFAPPWCDRAEITHVRCPPAEHLIETPSVGTDRRTRARAMHLSSSFVGRARVDPLRFTVHHKRSTYGLLLQRPRPSALIAIQRHRATGRDQLCAPDAVRWGSDSA
jgi:hypothetical protein